MKTSYNPAMQSDQVPLAPKQRPKKQHTYRNLFILWLLLILGGMALAFFYTQYIKNQITTDIARQTEQQLMQVQANYEKQIEKFQTEVQENLHQMENKVNTLSELLSFISDSENTKTDNSNQLYTQLAELKKQLDELKANLEVLKE